jgi:hypothetical protein
LRSSNIGKTPEPVCGASKYYKAEEGGVGKIFGWNFPAVKGVCR